MLSECAISNWRWSILRSKHCTFWTTPTIIKTWTHLGDIFGDLLFGAPWGTSSLGEHTPWGRFLSMNFLPRKVLPTRTSTSNWFLPQGTSSLSIFLSWEIASRAPRELPPWPLGKFLHQLVPFLGHDHAWELWLCQELLRIFAYNFPSFHDMPTQQVRSFYLLYCVDTLCALTSSMMKADGFHSIISP